MQEIRPTETRGFSRGDAQCGVVPFLFQSVITKEKTMNIVLDVAFIVAAVSFFKQQFDLKGPKALGAAFGVALLVGLAPVVSASFPVAQPYIDTVVRVVGLFIAAAGSFDFAKEISGQ